MISEAALGDAGCGNAGVSGLFQSGDDYQLKRRHEGVGRCECCTTACVMNSPVADAGYTRCAGEESGMTVLQTALRLRRLQQR